MLNVIFFFVIFSRIQTGKLSEFLTTSCFAHLSFLDVKGPASVGHRDEDDDGDGYVHELRHDDGKEKQSSGRTKNVLKLRDNQCYMGK